MPSVPWFRQPRATLEREQSRLLAQWVAREVVPFSSFWRERIGQADVSSTSAVGDLQAVTEAQIAGAGGPGNPALLLSPTETEFKRHASRQELSEAAREAGGRGATARRNAIWTRYKPVHVHEAGVDRLLAIAYTRRDLDRLHLAGARLAEVLGMGADDALLNLVAAGPSNAFWGLYHAALAARMTAIHPRIGGEGASAAARRGLGLLPASVVAVPIAEAAEVIADLRSRAEAAPNLRLLLTVGPPPPADVRVELAEQASALAGRPVAVQAVWAPEASRVLYGESPVAANDPPDATYGLLTYPDMEWLTVQDPATGKEVAEGEPGELVLTSLGWRGTALVRFATGTWVGGIERGSTHPVSGATVPRLAPQVADGAWQPKVRTVGGGTVRPDLRPASKAVAESEQRLGLQAWSLREVGGSLVLAVDAPGRDPEDLDPLLDRLASACGVRPALSMSPDAARRRPQVGTAG